MAKQMRFISGRRRGTTRGSSAVPLYLIALILVLVGIVTLVSFVIPQFSNLGTGSAQFSNLGTGGGLVVTSSSSISANQKTLIHNDLVNTIIPVSADTIWQMLLEEASATTGYYSSFECTLRTIQGH